MKKTFTRCFVLSVVLSLCASMGCNLDPETPTIKNDILGVFGENTILLCTDGLDNDGNGYVDCEDPGCRNLGTKFAPGPGTTVCPGTEVNGVWTPSENNLYTCSDGIDNDGNGYVDCADNNCKSLSVCCVKSGAENTLEACSDGIDNDCDGYVDCADFSCTKTGNKNDSSATPEAISYCETIQYPNGKITSPENTLEACSDGIDNDGDGYADCADYSCNGLGKSKDTTATPESIAYCSISEAPENTEESCSDGRDNNLNGYIDCDDEDCANTEWCKDSSPEPAARPDNFNSLDDDTKAIYLKNELDVCTDKVDNNKNGLIDCAEYECQILSINSQKYLNNEKLKKFVFSCQIEVEGDSQNGAQGE